MKIIGLTGGSGTGKGTVAARMRSLGAGWVDADAVYRGLCAENRAMLDALDAAFGGVTDENGALDRPKLAKIVFADPEKLAELNRITTPYIRAASLAAIRAQSACPVVLYDAPTLFEAGADDFCDAVIAVLAPHDTRAFRALSHATTSPRTPPAPGSTRSRATAFTAKNAAISSKTTAISIHCTGIPMLYIKFS